MAGKQGQKERVWSDDVKRSICEQTTTRGVSVAQVARRYSMNPNLIFKWLKDPRFGPYLEEGAAQPEDEDGFIDKIHVTPANVGESPHFGPMIEGSKAQRVLADKAYASKANREALKGKHRDGILHKAARGRPLSAGFNLSRPSPDAVSRVP